MDRITFTIPLPPSVNSLFANATRGRIKTPAYKAWLKSAGWEMRRQRVPLTSGRVEVRFWFPRPNESSDLDNRVKGALDLMVIQRVIEDDRFVEKITAEWIVSDECLVEVKPWIHPAVEADIRFYKGEIQSGNVAKEVAS